MINWHNLIYLIFGGLGTFALLLIQRFTSRLLPTLPFKVLESMRFARQATIDDNYQGDWDIYNLDRVLMESELALPGSTLRLYYHQPVAVFFRFIGSVLVSFTLTAWILEQYHFGWLSMLLLLFGSILLIYPYLIWNHSRPSVKE